MRSYPRPAGRPVPDGELLRYLQQLPSNISQVELFRTYFWKDLQHRLPREEIWLGRIFRPKTHKVGGDGMWLIRYKGDVVRLDKFIYHYSRLGDEKDITKRIRTLDKMFHDDEVIKGFKDFSYKEASFNELLEYKGTHPLGVKEFYE